MAWNGCGASGVTKYDVQSHSTYAHGMNRMQPISFCCWSIEWAASCIRFPLEKCFASLNEKFANNFPINRVWKTPATQHWQCRGWKLFSSIINNKSFIFILICVSFWPVVKRSRWRWLGKRERERKPSAVGWICINICLNAAIFYMRKEWVPFSLWPSLLPLKMPLARGFKRPRT